MQLMAHGQVLEAAAYCLHRKCKYKRSSSGAMGVLVLQLLLQQMLHKRLQLDCASPHPHRLQHCLLTFASLN
ncbi:hypothetical protein V5799_029373 [Amblyomma americanum]|uniref:Uncharacterized protein n=1 Tax=Amblyomma americanum TaxID=6943 RepID=A0AAQ4ERB1_AMBAM